MKIASVRPALFFKIGNQRVLRVAEDHHSRRIVEQRGGVFDRLFAVEVSEQPQRPFGRGVALFLLSGRAPETLKLVEDGDGRFAVAHFLAFGRLFFEVGASLTDAAGGQQFVKMF